MASRSACIHCEVRSRALCRALPAGRLSQLSRLMHQRRCQPGRMIAAAIYMGAGPAAMYASHAVEAFDQFRVARTVKAAG